MDEKPSAGARRYEKSKAFQYVSRILVGMLLLVLIFAIMGNVFGDRFIRVTSGIYISWDGIRWSLLDGRRDRVGDDELVGGEVVVDDLAELAVTGSTVVGRRKNGEYFIFETKLADSLPRIFTSHDAWLLECRQTEAGSPRLVSVSAFR